MSINAYFKHNIYQNGPEILGINVICMLYLAHISHDYDVVSFINKTLINMNTMLK
jgi:hypothetical protein